MSRSLLLVPALAAFFCMAPGQAEAKRSVGLGVGAGVAIPSIEGISIDPAVAWGFYTDIPLLSSFHITPSTLVYRIDPEAGGGNSATDVSLNFKFVVPIGPLDLFAGVTAGVTSANRLDPHVGGLAGFSLNIVSNLDVFVNAGYKVILRGKDDATNVELPNVGDLQIFAGPLIRFDY